MGQFFRAWRKHNGLSQKNVHDLTGIDPTQLSRLENSKRPYDQRTLELLAGAYKCSVTELLSVHPKDRDELTVIFDALTREQREQLLGFARVMLNGRQ